MPSAFGQSAPRLLHPPPHKPSKLSQCHQTLPFFDGRFRPVCSPIDRRFRPVGFPTPPTDPPPTLPQCHLLPDPLPPPSRPASQISSISLCHFFPTGTFGWSAPRLPPPSYPPSKLPQYHQTLPFFRQAQSAGRLPDPPEPLPKLRQCHQTCHFSDKRFRPVCSPTPPPPSKLSQCYRPPLRPSPKTSAMPSDFAIFATGTIGWSASQPPRTAS